MMGHGWYLFFPKGQKRIHLSVRCIACVLAVVRLDMIAPRTGAGTDGPTSHFVLLRHRFKSPTSRSNSKKNRSIWYGIELLRRSIRSLNQQENPHDM